MSDASAASSPDGTTDPTAHTTAAAPTTRTASPDTAATASPAAAVAPRHGRAAVMFIFVTVVLDVLALGVVIPVLPDLVKGFLGGDTPKAAQIYGAFGTVWALMQFVFSPLLGAASDRFGRRAVILTSNFGLGFDYILMAVAPSLGWLFLGRVISGITAAGFATAGAYIADVSPPEKRAASYGIIGAAWGLGFVLGPAMGGVLGNVDLRLPFWVAAALTLLNATYGIFVLPESLPPERRSGFTWARANPLGSMKLLRSHSELTGLAGVYALNGLAHYVLSSVFVLYAGFRYGWGERAVGLTLALVGVCNIIVQAVLVRRVVAWIGERAALLTGLTFGIAGYATYGLAPSGAVFLVAVPVFAGIGLFGPSAQGLMTRRVSPTEQGQLQGANSCIMGIVGMLGPGLFTQTFSYCIRPGGPVNVPGAPFLLAAALLVVAIPLAAWATRRRAAPVRSGV
ncbi:MAG: Tetracycline resistance protein, class C [Phycisphaerae bacterium]|nr:Tetracycline resistance protein, class C [Phycisphaerae bacterium]